MIKKKGILVTCAVLILTATVAINAIFVWFQFNAYQTKSAQLETQFSEMTSEIVNESIVLKRMLTYIELNKYLQETTENQLLLFNKDYAQMFMVVDDRYILSGANEAVTDDIERVKHFKWYEDAKESNQIEWYSDVTSDVRNDHLLLVQSFYNHSTQMNGVLGVDIDLKKMMSELSISSGIDLSNIVLYNDKGNMVFANTLIEASKPRYIEWYQDYEAIHGPFENMNGFIASYQGRQQVLFEHPIDALGLHLVYKTAWFKFQVMFILFTGLEVIIAFLLLRLLKKTFTMCEHYKTVKNLLGLDDQSFDQQVLKLYNHYVSINARMDVFLENDLTVALNLLKLDGSGYSKQYAPCARYLHTVVQDKALAMKATSGETETYAYSRLDSMQMATIENLMRGYLDKLGLMNQKRIDLRMINSGSQTIVTYIGDFIILSMAVIDIIAKSYDYLTVDLEYNHQSLYLKVRSKHYFDRHLLEGSSIPHVISEHFGGDLQVHAQEVWLEWPLFNHQHALIKGHQIGQYKCIRLLGYHLSKSNHFILKGYAEKLGFKYEKVDQLDTGQLEENDILLFNMPTSKESYQNDPHLMAHGNKIVITDGHRNDASTAITYLNCLGWIEKPLTQSKIMRLLENVVQSRKSQSEA